MRTPLVAIVIALALAGVVPLVAQEPVPAVPIEAGTKVRIHTPDAVVTGRLARLLTRGDSVVTICTTAGPPCEASRRSIARASVVGIDIARGNHWKRGAIAGGALGAAVGGFLGYIVGVTCESVTCAPTAPKVAIGAAAGGAIVGVVGALIGSAFTRW